MKKKIVKKMIVVVLVVGMLLGGFVVDGMVTEDAVQVVETQEVTVNPGDTLWDYVQLVEGREYTNGHALVDQIRELNDIDPSDHLMPGQRLTIPKEVK